LITTIIKKEVVCVYVVQNETDILEGTEALGNLFDNMDVTYTTVFAFKQEKF
jgi:hypothetical protein